MRGEVLWESPKEVSFDKGRASHVNCLGEGIIFKVEEIVQIGTLR